METQTTVDVQTSAELTDLFGTATATENLPVAIGDTPSDAVLVNKTEMSDEALATVDAIVDNFNLGDTNLVLMYGSDPQRKLSAFLDTLLEGVKIKDVDVAGEMVLQLSDGIKIMQLKKVKAMIQGEGDGWFTGIMEVLGMATNYVKAFYESQKAVTSKMDQIESMANNQIATIQEKNSRLDQLVVHSIEQVKALEVFVVAGEEILELAKDQYAQKAAEVRESRNQIEASNLRDMGRQLAAFDVRLLRLKEAYVESGSVTIERIRQIQESGSIEIQNLNDGVLFTVPKLKKAILQVAALNDIKSAQESRQKLDRIDAELDDELADSTDAVHTAAKESQGDALARVRRLEAVISNVEASIKHSVEIEKSTEQMRGEAADLLVGLKDRITDTLNEANMSVTDSAA